MTPRGRNAVKTQKARQEYALEHPLNSARDNMAPYWQTAKHPTGLLIMTILAVDR